MANDGPNFNENQNLLIGLAVITFLLFFAFIDEDDELASVCCCTTILLLLAIPFAATNNINNTSTYAPIEPSSLFSNELNKDIKKSKKRKPVNSKDLPLEWKQLKEIYPEAELDEYSDYYNFKSGNWDMRGLREDLDLMIKRTGKKPTKNIPNKESDFKSMSNMALRNLLREKGLKTTGVKSELISRLTTAQKQAKSEKNKTKPENKVSKKDTKKTVKQLKEDLEQSKNTETDLYAHPENSNNKLEDLKALKEMLSEGLIDNDDFKQMKKEILGK